MGARRAGDLQRTRVLLAEDDGEIRDALAWEFEDDGCEVVAVSNGADLLELLASSMLSATKPFHVVVCDVTMPGWTGLQAIENLAANTAIPPVVVITGLGSEEVHMRAKQAGAVAVLDKPFDINELKAIVRKVSRDGRDAQGQDQRRY
jgi:DNA-binding response OmpR family regulator